MKIAMFFGNLIIFTSLFGCHSNSILDKVYSELMANRTKWEDQINNNLVQLDYAYAAELISEKSSGTTISVSEENDIVNVGWIVMEGENIVGFLNLHFDKNYAFLEFKYGPLPDFSLE